MELGWKYNLGLAVSSVFGAKSTFRSAYRRNLLDDKKRLLNCIEDLEKQFEVAYKEEIDKCIEMKKRIENKHPIATKDYIERYIDRVNKMPEFKEIIEEGKEKYLLPIQKELKEVEAKIGEIEWRIGAVVSLKSGHNNYL